MMNISFFGDTVTEEVDGGHAGNNPLDLSPCSFVSDMLSNRYFIDSGQALTGSEGLAPAGSGLATTGSGLASTGSGLTLIGSGAKPQMREKVVLVPPRKWHRNYLDPQDIEVRRSFFKSGRPELTDQPKLDLSGFWGLPVIPLEESIGDNVRINKNGDILEVTSSSSDQTTDVEPTTQESIDGSDCIGASFVSCMRRFYGRSGTCEAPSLLLLPFANGLLPAQSVQRFNADIQRLDKSSSVSVSDAEYLREELCAIRNVTRDRLKLLIHLKQTTWLEASKLLETIDTYFNSCEVRLRRASESAQRADEERNNKRWQEMLKVVADVHGFEEEEKSAIGLEELVTEAAETMERLSAEILTALMEAEAVVEKEAVAEEEAEAEKRRLLKKEEESQFG